ncbi:DUF302 domain-containing protein [Ruegeria pomeroyi]|uniref:DUF302 domain-containing protein n=1 Tax=Ruegeria alba TaxID=2916756 RepID=A0ABS9NUK2_9RHOB|nr:DUF302 domain-containing protein [Ruegeria alba]MCE8517288.1 DUF302 domain-containing protein [Ruegeria pomeroyi]MCG6557900.1 DUF302 domain-containing protein [Ruegeria alba]
MKQMLLGAVIALTAGAASAQDAVTYTTTENFEDVTFGLESAIVGRGLVIDSVSHVGDMLERTRADVGSDVVLFEDAKVFSFCSAALSRKVMEADPMNIVFCPYGIFVAKQPGSDEVTIGFRQFPEGPMQEVQTLLDEIAREAIGE